VRTRADCDRLVRAFYDRALTDPIIGFLFVDVARIDLATHLPLVASFWETMLLGDRTYHGHPFGVHADLHARVELRWEHFARWLALWTRTVDELFAGERAELAKAHATRVAGAFQRRLRGFPSPADAPAPAGLALTRHG
jgi:hemoglobin